MTTPPVSILDYGMGNLYSVKTACDKVGLDAVITASPEVVAMGRAIILPGVGAFGQAKAFLDQSGLTQAILAAVAAGMPCLGICLGMQLLMEVSHEYGRHQGLGLFSGSVEKLPTASLGERTIKVPHIGWTPVTPGPCGPEAWAGTPLEDVPPGGRMYFVHSYQVIPEAGLAPLAMAEFAGRRFCCALARDNVWAFQFHPERSGPLGLGMYRSFARLVGAYWSKRHAA